MKAKRGTIIKTGKRPLTLTKLDQKIKTVSKKLTSTMEDNHYCDSFLAYFNIDTAGFVNPLVYNTPNSTYTNVGDTDTDRTGSTIKPHHIDMRFTFTCDTGVGSDLFNNLRVIIFRDKNSQGSLPLMSDLLEFSNVDPIKSPIKYINRKRFKVIHDKVYTVNQIAGGDLVVTRRIKKKLDGTSTFLTSTNNVACLGNNQWYWLVVSDSSATPHPELEVSNRLLFSA